MIKALPLITNLPNNNLELYRQSRYDHLNNHSLIMLEGSKAEMVQARNDIVYSYVLILPFQNSVVSRPTAISWASA